MSEMLNVETNKFSLNENNTVKTVNLNDYILTLKLENNLQDDSLKVEFKKLSEDAVIPTKATKYSAAYDFVSPFDCYVPGCNNSNIENITIPGMRMIQTGISCAWDNPDFYLQLKPRSGLALKHRITVDAGVIDYDYRQEIGIILRNFSAEHFHITKGMRIAQGIFIQSTKTSVTVVDEFTPIKKSTDSIDTERTGGFGSTGLN